MKKTCKKIMIAVMVLASIFVMTSCGSGKEAAGSENDKELNQTKHLNIAKQMVLGYIPLYIMEEKGWLEEALASEGYENVEVTYTEFESGPPENEAFAVGQQDIGVMGNVPAISGIAAGQERDIIGVAYNGEKTLGIIVPNTSQIKDVSELKGKKVGVVVGSIGQDFMNAILNNSGISMDEIEVVNLGVAELENALITNQVDAISAWNPTLIKICSDKNGMIGLITRMQDFKAVYKQ